MRGKLASLILLIIVMVLCLVTLCSCGSIADYTFAMQQYKQEITSIAGVDTVMTLISTTGQQDGDSVTISGEQVVQFEVDVEKAGGYNIVLDYYVLHNGIVNSEIDVVVQSSKAVRTQLLARWTDYGIVNQDNLGNDVLSQQFVLEQWITTRLMPSDYSTSTPLIFSFEKGTNTVQLNGIVGGEIAISNVRVVSIQEIIGYSEYKGSNSQPDTASGSQPIILQAEKPLYKNDSSIVADSDSSLDVTPYDSYLSRLNVIGLSESGDSITYQIDVSASGYYNIALNYRVDNANRTTFVMVKIDDKVPFGELLHYPLADNGSFSSHTLGYTDEPFDIYLEQGKHTLSFTIDSSMVTDSTEQLWEITQQLNQIYLDLKKVVGASGDTNRQWDTETVFPGLIDSLKDINKQLQSIHDGLKLINGIDANYQALICIATAIKTVDGMLKDPMYIPNNYAKLSEGTGSVAQTIVSAQEYIASTPLGLDAIALSSVENPYQFTKTSGWTKFIEGVKKFFHSFVADYSSVTDGKKVLNVWVARPRQYVDIMQQMVDSSDFAERTGYDVQFSVLADEGKIILSSIADIQPNACFGISNWLPYEMGIRGLTMDLSNYADYGDIINRFSTGAMVPLIADEIAFGLPETQDFYVMYYRKDIMAQYNISLPNTWDDVISILPELHRYGLNFYIPLSSSTSTKSIMTTAPFIMQQGGSLFSADGASTTIDDANSLQAIKMMTELYTLYGLPLQVNNFFDSFRNGSLPIGVSTFETYVKLAYAAPEITGLWDITLAPGTIDPDTGENLRYQAGSSTSVVGLDSGDNATNDATWELLKWWTSTEVQSQYANRLIMSFGHMNIWNSANLDAFDLSMTFSEKHKQTITEQWEDLVEIPRVPGWYMLERELSNAWNNIVLNGQNVRVTVEDATDKINKELQRKLTEFGYMENGVMVEPYTLTTPEYVDKLKGKGN